MRLLDDDGIGPTDRLRLIILYLLYRDGLLAGDIEKLLEHAQLRPPTREVIHNLELLGVRVQKPLKDTRQPPPSLFTRKPPPVATVEETSFSRFDTALKLMLEDQIRGTLAPITFPFTRPQLDPTGGLLGQENVSQASLRSAKPTWARTRPSSIEPRQRIIVFMAGGATYAEARACYEVSRVSQKDVFLATSHMITPGLFLRQLGDLSVDKRRLDIPAERPKPKAPAHLFETEPQPKPPPMTQPQPPLKSSRSPVPPTAGLGAMTISSTNDSRAKTPNGSMKQSQVPSPVPPPPSGKLVKKERDKEMDKKKKHHFF